MFIPESVVWRVGVTASGCSVAADKLPTVLFVGVTADGNRHELIAGCRGSEPGVKFGRRLEGVWFGESELKPNPGTNRCIPPPEMSGTFRLVTADMSGPAVSAVNVNEFLAFSFGLWL